MRRQRKLFRFILVILCVLCLFAIFWLTRRDYIKCYRDKKPSLPNLLDSEVKRDKTIFFIETSCKSEQNGKIVLNARQACSIESAARANPNFDVFLLFVSSGLYKNNGTKADTFLDILTSISNVKIRHIDLDEYFRGTPVENLWTEGIIESSRYIHSHMSDVLRFLTLWKYGGIYLDHDVIVLKSFENLPLNFAGIESEDSVGSTVLSFSSDENGHSLANLCLQELSHNFDRWRWAYNGPLLVSRFGLNICYADDIASLYDRTCRNFTFYSPGVFLPVRWQDRYKLFESANQQEVVEMTHNSYSIHIWNSLTGGRRIRIDEDSAFNFFARKYCPNVFKEVDLYF